MNSQLWTLGIGAAVTGILACFQQVRSVMETMFSWLIQDMEFDAGYISEAIEKHLYANYTCMRFGPLFFTGLSTFVRPPDRYEVVAYEQLGTKLHIFWDGWRPLFVWRDSPDKNKDHSGSNAISIKVKFFRGTFKPRQFVIAAATAYNKTKSADFTVKRYRIVHVVGSDNEGVNRRGLEAEVASPNLAKPRGVPLGWKEEDLGPRLNGRLQDWLIVSPIVKRAIDSARFWVKSQQWYVKRGVPWKMGWQIKGQPGTGKTSLVRAVAQDLDMPIFVYDLATLTNAEFKREWSNMLSQTMPVVALFEDIDAVFRGRKNVARPERGLSFDCLLNAIDGVQTSDGVFLMVTTNAPDTIDPALGVAQGVNQESTRPGRIDTVLEMALPDQPGYEQVVRRIMDEHPELWDEQVKRALADKLTICQFQSRCAKLATSFHWQKLKSGEDKQGIPNLAHEVAAQQEIRYRELQCEDPSW